MASHGLSSGINAPPEPLEWDKLIKVVRDRLKEQEELLKAVLETTHKGFVVVDSEGGLYYANDAYCELTGRAREELLEHGWKIAVAPEDQKLEAEVIRRIEEGLSGHEVRYAHYVRPDGTVRHTRRSCRRISWTGKNRALVSMSDITELKEAQKRLDEAYHYFYEVFDQTSEMLIVFDSNGRILEVNRAVEALFGYSKEEVLAPEFDWWRCVHPEEKEKVLARLKLLVETGQPQRLEMKGVRKDGSVIELLVSYSIFNGLQSGPSQILGVHVDISPIKRLEAELRYLSFHDTLTGLFNRAYFEQELRRLSKGRTAPVGVVVLDVDDLKPVNDTLGHQAGDALLRRAAGVIKESFRAEDVIARVGGDEFAALVVGANEETLKGVLERLKKAIAHNNETRPEPRLSLSAGFAIAPYAPFQHEALFQAADRAMYNDKTTRKRARGKGKSLPDSNAARGNRKT